MSDYPPQVGKMVEALERLNGIYDIDVDLQAIDEITVDSLSLPAEFALLPHVAIRRSNGGKANEALVTISFKLEKSKSAWVILEFLSWWVRDMCRSSHEIQLRPLALPPSVGNEQQLGHTLSFLLEIFIVEPSDDPMNIADYVGDCGDSLNSSIDIYTNEINEALSN